MFDCNYRRVRNAKLGASAPKNSPFTSSLKFLCFVSLTSISWSKSNCKNVCLLDLKRFSPGERFRKLDASVDFPLTDLDMSAYTSPGIKQLPCSYQLYGVINHSGSAYSGHYTASCRHPFSGNWHEYNDSRWHRFSLKYIKLWCTYLKHFPRISNLTPQRVVSSEAYLLFYELESNDARL